MTTDPMERCLALIVELDEARLIGYGDVLPGPLDACFSELARLYAAGDEGYREEVRELVPEQLALLLLGFSTRLATVAARTDDEQTLFEAGLSHAIEDFRHDPRENIRRLAAVNHVAHRLGVESGALFSRISALASPRAAQHLREFAARPEATKSITCMGLQEVQTPDGVAYEALW